MSEKRFTLDKIEKGNATLSVKITDSVSDTDYFIMTKEAYEDDIDEVVDLLNVMNDTLVTLARENYKLSNKLNEQQEFIEELQVSDEMGWKRAEHFEKKCPKELHNKKMYIKRLEYKVQKFKEENEQLRQTIGSMIKEATKISNRNVQLHKQLKEKEQDEQLYANEILELRKANKEFREFKELGGDY